MTEAHDHEVVPGGEPEGVAPGEGVAVMGSLGCADLEAIAAYYLRSTVAWKRWRRNPDQERRRQLCTDIIRNVHESRERVRTYEQEHGHGHEPGHEHGHEHA